MRALVGLGGAGRGRSCWEDVATVGSGKGARRRGSKRKTSFHNRSGEVRGELLVRDNAVAGEGDVQGVEADRVAWSKRA